MEKEQRIFRVNMYIVEIVYKEILESATLRFENVAISTMNNECLFWMLGTEGSRFSKYKSGGLVKATKTIEEHVQECKPLYAAMVGQKLLIKDIRLEELERGFIDKDSKKQQELSNRIQQMVRNMFQIYSADVKDQELLKVVEWMYNKIAQYLNKEKDDEIDYIRKIYSDLCKIKFDDYAKYDVKFLENVQKVMKQQTNHLDCMIYYKKNKRRSSKNQKRTSDNSNAQ